MTSFSALNSMLEAPCREVQPLEPFPFKSNRISQGIRFKHYLILFPFYPEYKKLQHLYTFNLLTRKWDSVQLRNSPEILENTDNYKVVSDDGKEFLLFGCYKAFQANTTGNLFFQSQAITLKKTLGLINLIIDEGELKLEWIECKGADQLPYREKFCVHSVRIGDYIKIFGGCDENGKVTNDLYLFDLSKRDNEAKKHLLKPYRSTDKDEIPCARMNHGNLGQVVFGGEDHNSDALYDYWNLRSFEKDATSCTKLTALSMNRYPKFGSQSISYDERSSTWLYIGRSMIQTLPPFRSYLCVNQVNFADHTVQTWSQKDPLPFDGVPHTMEIYESRLILGFETSIYSISFDNEASPAPDFESYLEDRNDVMVTKKIRPKNFKGHMRQYFKQRPFPDVVFRIQGEEVTAHRGILSVRCPYFAELFGSKSGENQSQPIEITDLSLRAFNALLEWLYCNEILGLKDNTAAELVKVRNKYSLPKLKIEAEKCLIENLAVETVLERARLAVEHNVRDLETAIVKYVVKEIDEVNKREEFGSLPDSIKERVSQILGSRTKPM